jgi:hypothetical protein
VRKKNTKKYKKTKKQKTCVEGLSESVIVV